MSDSESTEGISSRFLRGVSDLLPDSFAPLLSSSQTEVVLNQLTPELIHGLVGRGEVVLREGSHAIPLNKDGRRPQLTADVQKGKARIVGSVEIGSFGSSREEDFDVSRVTTARTLTMVKRAGLTLDPPLALRNVAPTLVHLPSLFEDNSLPVLRELRGGKFGLGLLSSWANVVERFLWVVESRCQIHLSKVSVTPTFRGAWVHSNWRLQLSFSGYVLLFGWIKIPFFAVTLPTFIIPTPHAFLRHLMTPQPLASAKLRRENLSEEKIVLAVMDAIESWNSEVKAVATPPAFSVDVTLPGGMTVAVETLLGRDVSAGSWRMETSEREMHSQHSTVMDNVPPPSGGDIDQISLSSFNTPSPAKRHINATTGGADATTSGYQKPFDANVLVPWTAEVALQGTLNKERISVNLSKVSLTHKSMDVSGASSSSINNPRTTSQVTASGSFVVFRADPDLVQPERFGGTSTPKRHRTTSNPNMHELAKACAAASIDQSLPSVYSTLLFPDMILASSGTTKFQRMKQVMQYDYSLDFEEDTNIDFLSISMGLTHPMLNGSTIITTVLESIYASGSVTAREGALLNPLSPARKRNFLRHLPAIDLSVGIHNLFIPDESLSYHDDGQTRCIPRMQGGRMSIRLVGGFLDDDHHESMTATETVTSAAASTTAAEEVVEREKVPGQTEGVKILVDFGVNSFALDNETHVNEFPELEVFDGSKLYSFISGTCSGRLFCHLRPQKPGLGADKKSFHQNPSSTDKNFFNPLEAYELAFSGSSASVKIREWTSTLGHRRLIIPSETAFFLRVLESVVDMSFEGMTRCECSWDFQGLSPMLQVTSVGHNPADAHHEDKHQVPILISDLRQGRLNFNVSPVGGINITQAVTSRAHREGLYDWKFFNALVSPDEESPNRIMQVLHDKRTMQKFLEVIKLINAELGDALSYILKQVWRAKEIFDEEGITGPGHVIPGHKLSRLLSLFLTGDLNRVDDIMPIIQRVTRGDGLDVVKVKELLHENLNAYDKWASEIDRVVRWMEVMLGPISAQFPFVEDVPPLCELPHYMNSFAGIPSAKELYHVVQREPHLPLDPSISKLVARIAPYMTFHQVQFILRTRSRPRDWRPADLRRLRYVFSVKKKVLDISESYGGLSFLPQSFFVSVFLGEATRASLRAQGATHGSERENNVMVSSWSAKITSRPGKGSTLSTLRSRRMTADQTGLQSLANAANSGSDEFIVSPAGRVASRMNLEKLNEKHQHATPLKKPAYQNHHADTASLLTQDSSMSSFELGNSLLGPQDVAILLQAGLTSAMKGSTVVQLNQRMILDLIASQPKGFAVAVLAEIGKPGGHGSSRGLASALMALLELDQSSFKEAHRLDMHTLLESWLGLKMPEREEYLAGGRWARQSYYEAVFHVAKNVLEDAEPYMALRGHIQRVRHHSETDPVPRCMETTSTTIMGERIGGRANHSMDEMSSSKLSQAIKQCKERISKADSMGKQVLSDLARRKRVSKDCPGVIEAYRGAFEACVALLKMDKLAFQANWFKSFYRRNYDALMIQSIYDNVVNDVDSVRKWLDALRRGSLRMTEVSAPPVDKNSLNRSPPPDELKTSVEGEEARDDGGDDGSKTDNKGMAASVDPDAPTKDAPGEDGDSFFGNVEARHEQEVVDAIIDCVFYDASERGAIRNDPLMRLLIPNPPGKYNFTIVLAMGIITEGKRGLELEDALDRIRALRGVEGIRSDTGTARSVEFNASRIEEAVKAAVSLGKPFGFLGYSQGCSNALTAESMLCSGSPIQQQIIKSPDVGLVCRQLVFSAANGSIHGPASDQKIQRLIIMCEQAFKYQQGYFSRAFISAVLELINGFLDSAGFHKFVGGTQTFLPEGSRAFWREAQHLPHVPTTVLRGVEEEHTTPECLEMMSNLLTKQSGSSLHDSQVHVFDAVGHPVYAKNRNGDILTLCDMGGAIQRTHHWSPLDKEVEFLSTAKDKMLASFDCAKDRHIFPWVDVNARFGFIKYAADGRSGDNNGGERSKRK